MQLKISEYAEFEKLHDVLREMIRLYERRSLGDRLKYSRFNNLPLNHHTLGHMADTKLLIEERCF